MPILAFVTICGEGGVPAKTVDSVLAQSHTDFIYCLAPTAGDETTTQNLRAYAESDARIAVLGAPAKGGVAAAWNTAFDAAFAAGARFVAPVEPGDTLAPGFAETTLALAEDSGADVVLARFAAVDESGEELGEPLVGFGENIVLAAAEFAENYSTCSMFPGVYECWGKLLRAQVVRAAALKMDEGRGPGFIARYYNHCDKICLCDDVLQYITVSDDPALIFGAGVDAGRDEAKTLAAASVARHAFLAKYSITQVPAATAAGGELPPAGPGGELPPTGAAGDALTAGLPAAGPSNSTLMADYHDLNEASAFLYRLLDIPLPPADAARRMAGVLSLGFLPAAWDRLYAAFSESGTLFGLAEEKAQETMAGMDCVFREALCFLFINGNVPLKSPLESWMRTLCPVMMRYYNVEELPPLAKNAALFQNLACENWRVALLHFNNVPVQDYQNAVHKAFLCRTLGVGEEFVRQFLKQHGKKISAKKRAYLDGASMPGTL